MRPQLNPGLPAWKRISPRVFRSQSQMSANIHNLIDEIEGDLRILFAAGSAVLMAMNLSDVPCRHSNPGWGSKDIPCA
jgi:hypothetical protein